MKLKYIIVLIFLYSCNLLAVNTAYTDKNAIYINTIITAEPGNEPLFDPPRVAADDTSGAMGSNSFSGSEDETLDSVLGYFIFIFLSVLVIILIDNRNLEKRYKKLVADYKTKDPIS